VVVAPYHQVADGTGATIRSEHPVTALNKAALAAFTTARPHRRKEGIPTGPTALTAAEALRAKHHCNRADRSFRLCGRRRISEEPGMITPSIDKPTPTGQGEAGRYQQLRSHLTTLKLLDAAEALPTVLDQARTEKLTPTAVATASEYDCCAFDGRRIDGRPVCVPHG
jgi:hypothetical protein